MSKHFVLIIEYTTGECAFPVDTDNLQEALAEFQEEVKTSFSSVIGDKSFALPQIVSARIVKLYYRK